MSRFNVFLLTRPDGINRQIKFYGPDEQCKALNAVKAIEISLKRPMKSLFLDRYVSSTMKARNLTKKSIVVAAFFVIK